MSLKSAIKRYYLVYIKKMSENEIRIAHLKKIGMKIGVGSYVFSDIETNEPYLVSIGDSVILSKGVRLLTHDASAHFWSEKASDIFARVTIGDHVFIGENAIVMCGVSITHDVIIGAGSIVTKSIEEPYTVWAGNPAKKIADYQDMQKKYKDYDLNTWNMSFNEKKQYLLEHEDQFKKS